MNFYSITILLTLGALSIAKSSVFASVVAPIGLAPRFVPPNVFPFAASVATETRGLYPYVSGVIPVSRILPAPLLPQTPIVAPAIPHVAPPPITPFTAVVPEAVSPPLVPAPVPFEARSIHAVAPAAYPAVPPAFPPPPPVASSLGR